MELSEAELWLQTYTLDEILELNEITDEELVELLVNLKIIQLPNPRPVDLSL